MKASDRPSPQRTIVATTHEITILDCGHTTTPMPRAAIEARIRAKDLRVQCRPCYHSALRTCQHNLVSFGEGLGDAGSPR